tara:strand:+ start:4573 stop:5070 length:498 start_codon:yes stop_codon:yes gene_type:complete
MQAAGASARKAQRDPAFAKKLAEENPFGASAYSSLLREARGAGLDPRTISFFRQEETELTRLQEEANRRLKKKKSGIFGKLRSIFSPASIAKARGAVKVQEAKLEDLAGNIRSEITKAIEIQKLKRMRSTAVEELQQATGTTKRGRASLLASDQGGKGFFSRYFG